MTTIGINTNTLLEMLTYQRPGRSKTEEEFIDHYLMTLPGAYQDEIGNVIVRIGTDPIMWSSHTDTVHHKDGRQLVHVHNGIASVVKSNCLGADCTTGVWIMREMILAGKEGLYIFHRDEERGAHGSHYIVTHTPDLVEGIQAAIAFDRYGHDSIITYQLSKCCSNDFADSMIEQMPGYRRDPNGIFTDTAFYVDLIPECTNVSVGYKGHHSAMETQDINHAKLVVELMLALDTSKLRISRDPSVKDTGYYGMWDDDEIPPSHRHAYRSSKAWLEEEVSDPRLYGSSGIEDYTGEDDDTEQLVRLIGQNPEAAAAIFEDYGITALELVERAFSLSGK